MRSTFRKISVSHVDKILALSVGLVLFALYLLVYRGGFHSVDEVSMFAVTESMVKFGKVNTDQIAWTQWTTSQREAQGFFGIDGHVYSKKGFGLSLVMVPFYWLGWVIPGLGMLQTASLVNLLITAVTAGVLYLTVRRLDYTPRVALLVSALYGTATIAAVYSKYLFSEPLAGLLLLLAVYLSITYRRQRRGWLAAAVGLCAGLAVITRANNLFLVPLFGLYLLAVAWIDGPVAQGAGATWQRRVMAAFTPLISFGIGLLPPAVILMGYNLVRSGNPLSTGYDLTIFSPNILFGLYKLLFSPLRGLFVYSPLLLLALLGIAWWWRRHKLEALLVAGIAGVTVLLFSAWTSGEGLSWGSRFLVPVVPVLCIALAPVVQRALSGSWPTAAAVLVLGLVSLIIQVLGIVINPWIYLAALQENFGGQFFLEKTAALADFGYAQPLGQLQAWSAAHSDLAWWQAWGTDWVSLALAGALLLLTAGNLWLQLRNGRAKIAVLVASLVALPLVAGCLLGRYYVRDLQFGPPDDPYTQALEAARDGAAGTDSILTVAPYHYHVAMNRFKARIPLIGFAQQDPPLPATALPLLQAAAAGQNAWLVTVGFPPAAPNNAAEAWLCQNEYKANDQWLADARLVRFGTTGPTQDQANPEVTFGQAIQLLSAGWQPAVVAGDVLGVTLTWQALVPPPENWHVFLQLLSAEGSPVAQNDSPPGGGYLPTTEWQPAQRVADHHGLFIPRDLPAGTYRLIAGLYDPATGQRLAAGPDRDFVELGLVAVQSRHR